MGWPAHEAVPPHRPSRATTATIQTMIASGMRITVKNMTQPTMIAAQTARLKLKEPAATTR